MQKIRRIFRRINRRGMKHMSASSKKKLRKELASQQLTEKQRTEQKEAKKLKVYTIAFIAVIALVVVSALGIVISRQVTTSGVVERNTQAVKIGDHTLSSAELSYYYVDLINSTYSSWRQSYGDYTTAYLQLLAGLDLTKPLSGQIQDPESNTTWADYFVNAAIENARNTYAVYDAAVADGYTLTEDDQKQVDAAISTMTMYATYYRFSSLESYLKSMYGYGSTEESFRAYCEVTTLASSYQAAHSNSLTYDDAAIRAFDAEHAREFSSYSYASYYLPSSNYLTGGTTGEDNTVTYTPEQRAAAAEEAKRVAESLIAGETRLDFDKAIGRLDTGSDTAPKATESENVLYSSVNTLLQEWVTDPSRQEGDMTVIPSESTSTAEDGTETTTVNGYYAVYFVGCRDNTMSLANVRHLLVKFEGGTTENGATTYSDEEKAAAKAEAEELLAQWQAGDATEESFAALVTEKTDDTASASTGGLYENITPDSNYVENFLNWCMEDHKAGDTGIVESSYGYHIMYYVGDSARNYRDTMIESRLLSDEMTAWFEGITEAVEYTVLNTSKLNRDLVLASS